MKRTRESQALVLMVLAAATQARADDVVVLVSGSYLQTFDPTTGAIRDVQTLKGVEDGGRILSIDTRPSNGALYGLGANRLYRLDPATGWAVPVGEPMDRTLVSIPDHSLEFDPTTDVARVFLPAPTAGTRAGRNELIRLDPDTGAVLTASPGLADPTAVSYAQGDIAAGQTLVDLALGHLAAPSAALFGIDRDRLTLVRVAPVDGDETTLDAAVATTVGALGLPESVSRVGLEIAPDGAAYALGMDFDRVAPAVFSVDLATGAATLLAEVPQREDGWDLAMRPTAPTPALQALNVTSAAVRLDTRKVRRSSIDLRGTLPAPGAAGWKGRTVRLSVAASPAGTTRIERVFTLSARGRAVSGAASFVAGTRARDGQVAFSLRLARGDFPQFEVAPGSIVGRLFATVDLLVDGTPLRASLSMNYAVRRGRVLAHRP
jgi:hypothetical protein